MSYRMGIRPSKPAAAVGLAAGVVFLLLGVAVVIPIFGTFGVFWTAIAALIALYYAYLLFSRRGVSAYEVDVNSPEDDLRKLAQLRQDGLLSEEEYQRKRSELMARRW
jgi:Short C-terminal domain